MKASVRAQLPAALTSKLISCLVTHTASTTAAAAATLAGMAAAAAATAPAPPAAPPSTAAGAYAAGLDDIKSAAQRISGHAHLTPVLTCTTLDRMTGCKLHFKCENLQKGGAFKFRGALNSVLSLSDEQAARGVVTHSSGNHAGALALAAQLRGIPAHIVVPRDAPTCKQQAVQEYNGNLILCEPTLAAREATCADVAARTGATFIPPYDYAPVIAGQGTIALELLQQVPQLDVVVVPVSGGGMLSGIALAAHALKPGLRVIAAEPAGSNNAADAAASKAAGQLVTDLPKPSTIADGLQARLGQLTWPVVRDLVHAVVVVAEADIIKAMQLLFERAKLVVEPSGAAALAAVMSPGFAAAAGRPGGGDGPPLQVGVVLSGGNVDFGAKGFWADANWQPVA